MATQGRVKVGIIGSQFEADIHAASFQIMPDEAEVVAVTSPTPGHAKALAQRYKIPRVFTDYRQMLAEDDIEMVTITAPNALHCQMTVDIANAGKHVVCEKPLCMTLEEADLMIDTCRRKGVLLMYAEELYFTPKYVKAKEMADQGAFGKVYLVKQSEKHFGPHAPWFWDVNKSGGGVLMDMGCHGIAFCWWFLGRPEIRDVYCQMGTYVHADKTQGEDNSVCIIEFANDAVGLIEDSWARRGGMEDRIEVYGEGGVTHADLHMGDALDRIHVVGAMGQPEEVAETWRDVFLTGELVKGTTKPTRCWVRNGQTARVILEIYRAVAGGDQALRQQPMAEAFLEPISPLQLPGHGLEIVKVFAQAGQPVSIGPMAMTSATAPGTLAGTLAQENAEILAGLVVTQLFAPGTPVMYGGIPHIMDARTSICSFGSPEQGLMAAAMVQMAKSYGLPAYINVGLTDAKTLDAQAGAEKASSLLLGALAGADTFGHCGICGTDHGANLEWLYVDNELAAYVERVARGFEVDSEKLAAEIVGRIGPGGNFLADEHTVRHFREELWMPGSVWTRQSWDGWENAGSTSMAQRVREQVQTILATHEVEPLDERLAREIDRIVACARDELG